jgi:hexokinase
VLEGKNFSPVPPNMDGSPRATVPKTYEQRDGLMIDAGGTRIDVRGSSRGNSPVNDFKVATSNFIAAH